MTTSNDLTHTRPAARTLAGRALLIAGALGLLGLGYTATSTAGAPQIEPAQPAAERPSAKLALGYQPKNEPIITAAQRAVQRSPGSAEAHARLALAMLQRKRETADAAYYEYALDALEAATAIDPDATEVLLARTLAAHEAHRFHEAKKLAERLVARAPDESTGHLLLGDAHLELGDYLDAVTAYQRAVDLRPDLRSYDRAAHLRWLHGDFDGAKELIELAIEAGSPRDPEAIAWCYVDLGEMYAKRGDGSRALRSARRALELVANYHPALVLEAKARARLGETEDAVRLLERAVKKHPRVQDLLLLSELLASASKSDAARARVRQAERLGDEDPRPLALYYARHGIQRERALELAERELDARHGIEAHAAHALALVRAARPKDAARAIERAMALGTQDADLHVYRAMVRWAEGDRTGASAALARALELDSAVDPLLVAELRTKLDKEQSP